MNLHEYQGKKILSSLGIRVQRGIIAQTPAEAVAAAKELTETTGTKWCVVEAQIHAGERGKGGGVKLAKGLQDVEPLASQIIGMRLITPQTSPTGKEMHQILIAEDVYYPGENEPAEFYMSVLLNRTKGKNMVAYSTEGGMDIETVAAQTPHPIFTEKIDPAVGLQPFQARQIAFNLGPSGEAQKDMVKSVTALYNAYVSSDANLLEINPMLKTSDNKVLAVDAKVVLDNNALFRHPKYAAYRDIREENPVEAEAKAVGLDYIALDGNVGCMISGAGLVMATMDLIKQAGGPLANFPDARGTTDAERVEAAFRITLKDPNVKVILINIFGGIVHCDRVAQEVVGAYQNMGDAIKVPIIMRLQGTNAELAKEILDNSGLIVHSVILSQEVADKVRAVVSQ